MSMIPCTDSCSFFDENDLLFDFDELDLPPSPHGHYVTDDEKDELAELAECMDHYYGAESYNGDEHGDEHGDLSCCPVSTDLSSTPFSSGGACQDDGEKKGDVPESKASSSPPTYFSTPFSDDEARCVSDYIRAAEEIMEDGCSWISKQDVYVLLLLVVAFFSNNDNGHGIVPFEKFMQGQTPFLDAEGQRTTTKPCGQLFYSLQKISVKNNDDKDEKDDGIVWRKKVDNTPKGVNGFHQTAAQVTNQDLLVDNVKLFGVYVKKEADETYQRR